MRNTIIVAVAAIVLAGCERATAPVGPRTTEVTPASSATTFSGDAKVVQATITPGVIQPIGITLVETGPLAESGDALSSTLLTLAISKDQTANLLALNAEVGHASTVGQGKRSDGQATVANLSLDVGGNTIQATFLQALASAVCDAVTGAIATGSSTLSDLFINGVPYSVGTAPNQVLVDVPALKVVANEQTPADGTGGSITVNALHVTVYALNVDGSRGAQLADVVVASAHADIHCGSCTDIGNDFTTGGGWISAGSPPEARRQFAVAGGYKNGVPWGHLTYLDKAADLKVKGTSVISYQSTPTATGNASTIDGMGELADGTPVHYTVTVQDNGEPGDADTFDITLSGGAVYHSYGVLGGGNIQFHGKPSPCS